MIVRDIDFEYFKQECIKYGATEEQAKKAAAVRVEDSASKETGQSPQLWDDGKWVDTPKLVVTLTPDSDFGRVRPRRKTVVFSLLGKDDKVLWTSK